MSFTMISALVGSNSPVDAFSYPNRVSFCVGDSGSGGTLNVNGLGVNDPIVGGAMDLATFFTPAYFRSIPLLAAFRAIPVANANVAEVQLVQELEVTIVAVSGTVTKNPAINYLGLGPGSGPTVNTPFLQIIGPAVTGSWRVDLRLRHSLTG